MIKSYNGLKSQSSDKVWGNEDSNGDGLMTLDPDDILFPESFEEEEEF